MYLVLDIDWGITHHPSRYILSFIMTNRKTNHLSLWCRHRDMCPSEGHVSGRREFQTDRCCNLSDLGSKRPDWILTFYIQQNLLSTLLNGPHFLQISLYNVDCEMARCYLKTIIKMNLTLVIIIWLCCSNPKLVTYETSWSEWSSWSWRCLKIDQMIPGFSQLFFELVKSKPSPSLV